MRENGERKSRKEGRRWKRPGAKMIFHHCCVLVSSPELEINILMSVVSYTKFIINQNVNSQLDFSRCSRPFSFSVSWLILSTY